MDVVGTVAIGWVQDGRVTSAYERVEAVYRARGTKLWRALLAFTSDPDLASDALAEAFAQVLARRDTGPRSRGVGVAVVVPDRGR
jgi:hypothetical protein